MFCRAIKSKRKLSFPFSLFGCVNPIFDEGLVSRNSSLLCPPKSLHVTISSRSHATAWTLKYFTRQQTFSINQETFHVKHPLRCDSDMIHLKIAAPTNTQPTFTIVLIFIYCMNLFTLLCSSLFKLFFLSISVWFSRVIFRSFCRTKNSRPFAVWNSRRFVDDLNFLFFL